MDTNPPIGMQASPAPMSDEKKVRPFMWVFLAIASIFFLGVAAYVFYSQQGPEEEYRLTSMEKRIREEETVVIEQDLQAFDIESLGSELGDIEKEIE